MSEGVQMALRAAMAGESMESVTKKFGASLTVHDREVLGSITKSEIDVLTGLEKKARLTKGMPELDAQGGMVDGVWIGGIW